MVYLSHTGINAFQLFFPFRMEVVCLFSNVKWETNKKVIKSKIAINSKYLNKSKEKVHKDSLALQKRGNCQMKIDENARYSKTHEWVRKEGDLYVIGISDHAQRMLKDIVYVEMPSVGTTFNKGEKVCDIESVKAVAELMTPISGEVAEIHEELENTAEVINKDPYGEGWFIKIKPSNPVEFDELMTPNDYSEFLEKETEEH